MNDGRRSEMIQRWEPFIDSDGDETMVVTENGMHVLYSDYSELEKLAKQFAEWVNRMGSHDTNCKGSYADGSCGCGYLEILGLAEKFIAENKEA